MGFDRSRFQAPKLDTNKRVSEDVNKTMKVNDSNRGDYLKIDEGMNTFRLFPPHNDNEPTFQPKVVYWIECRVQKTDPEGKAIAGQFEWVRRPIFDSRIHGGTAKDIMDEYIKFTKRVVFDTYADKEDAKKKLSAINGWKGKDGKWNPGITPSTSFVAYATKGDITIANLGRLELWQREKEELEKLNIDDKSGEVLSTDIWSGPDDGVQFTINRIRNANGKLENNIAKRTFSPDRNCKDYNSAFIAFMESMRIPDDVLEHWSKMEPLSAQFKNTYKRTDFERAVEALQKFDTDNGYNTFENDEFLMILREIDGYYPDEAETTQETQAPKAETKPVEVVKPTIKSISQPKPIEVPQVAESVKEPISVDYLEMSREDLKKLIVKNSLGIRVLKSTTTEELARKVAEAMKALEPEVDEEEEQMPEDMPESIFDGNEGAQTEVEKLPFEDEPEIQTPATNKAQSLRDRLSRMNK